MSHKYKSTAFAILAAALYSISIPLSKLMLQYVSPAIMAALLYLGAGVGLLIYGFFSRITGKDSNTVSLTQKDLPYIIAMIVLDVAAPILLMLGVSRTASANVSLLSNFEIVSTALTAFLIFGERISWRLWISVALVTSASILLGFENSGGVVFNTGSLFVIGACLCWGFENNCTKKLSGKSSAQIVTVKGCFSGLGSLIIAFLSGERLPAVKWIFVAMILGFVAYGLSINFYILAQKELGAAKTSAYYSSAPFFGVMLCMIIVGERPKIQFYIALAVMAVSTVIMTLDTIVIQRKNEKNDSE